jgi:hypothetical protein
MTRHNPIALHLPLQTIACGLLVLGALGVGGCPASKPQPEIPLNTTDPTNGGASYVTTEVCSPCHFDITEQQQLTGHRHMLQQIISGPPVYPPQATRAGVPNPPPGFSWDDISFVLGGYLHKANFLDSHGYLMTDGTDGVHTQWDLAFPANQTVPHFASFLPGQTTALPYSVDCFRCHTTGPSSTGNEMALPGIHGAWVQPGVQCEACHGPGSRHVPDPPANIYVNPTAAFCGQCHSRQQGGPVLAANGFILNEQQYPELLVSPHASMQCVACHNPHASPNYDPANALVNDCQNCHADHNMALHAGKVLTTGSYTETLTCHSCHMPFATVAATSLLLGGGRIGDVRTHVFRINPGAYNYTTMFSSAGDQVRTGTEGQAALTLDFVCLRCHNGAGNAFALNLSQASGIADGIHEPPQ